MHSRIVSRALRQVAAEGQQRVVVYDYRNNRKAPLPDAIRRRIVELEKQP
jgi:acyl-CoA thioesterase FadM